MNRGEGFIGRKLSGRLILVSEEVARIDKKPKGTVRPII